MFTRKLPLCKNWQAFCIWAFECQDWNREWTGSFLVHITHASVWFQSAYGVRRALAEFLSVATDKEISLTHAFCCVLSVDQSCCLCSQPAVAGTPCNASKHQFGWSCVQTEWPFQRCASLDWPGSFLSHRWCSCIVFVPDAMYAGLHIKKQKQLLI